MNRVKAESFIKDWLPKKVYVYLFKRFADLQFFSFNKKELIKANKSLKNTKKGKRCFMIATGPSLKLENLKLLENEDCYTISNAFLHEDIKVINPLAHFYAPYHEPLILDNYLDWLQKSDKELPERTKIVTGHKNIPFIESREGLFKNRKVEYLFLARHTDAFNDISKPIMPPINGPQMMIPYLLYLGYSEIYLLGCDSTVMRDYKKANITHFYDSKKKDVRKNASDQNSWSKAVDQFKYQYDHFKVYEHFNSHPTIQSGEQKILNLSQDSWIDSYPFETLDHIIQKG
ncbi:hypothetical protein [Flammeovirga sp. SJP92]|uniref:hypothetical protein n=1 Tax=Flammeovirga sp. SJP92 TaxID=1775430 RepID=UPI000787E20B|nr:hypothetical protein [Flammeovirga sp. SJP92]KXX67294.1 hypothetical protein AVL50_28330 [Flammeovirga sp. SJP92]